MGGRSALKERTAEFSGYMKPKAVSMCSESSMNSHTLPNGIFIYRYIYIKKGKKDKKIEKVISATSNNT